MDNLLNILFPPKCLNCGKGDTILCRDCYTKCKVLNNQYCVVCDRPSKSGVTHERCKNSQSPSQCVSVFQYEDIVRTCIKTSKYNSKEFFVLKYLIGHIFEIYPSLTHYFKDSALIPIPISDRKMKLRGFNQAEVIANSLSGKVGSTVCPDLLVRAKDTFGQHSLTRKERFANLAGAFKVSEKYLNKASYKQVMLIDDICTTGATLLEASKTLYTFFGEQIKVNCFTLSKKAL